MTTIMENLIEEANKLQLVASKVNENLAWELPEICVVGAQSSGKSSLLDRIVGRPILPRGDGMVTKTPIRLELNPILDTNKNGTKEYVEFGHKQGKFTDMKEVTNEIVRQMNFLVDKENRNSAQVDNLDELDQRSSRKGVSSTPVLVKFFSPKVLKLTLVDMPGLIRLAEPGSNLPDEIDELVRNYIKKPNVLIVALTVADDDAENSAGYAEALKADPEGLRTLVVVTKVDRALNTDKTKSLLLGNEAIKPKLGIVGVINKFPDTDDNNNFNQKKEAELTFFQSKFEPYLGGKYGVEYLSVKLQEVLYKHIKKALPLVLPKITPKMDNLRKQITWLGDEVDPDTIQDKDSLLMELIEKYSNKIKKILEGEPEDIPVKDSVGGAKIRYIMFNDLPKALKTSALFVLDTISASKLDNVIDMTDDRPSTFTNHKAIEFFLNQVIDALMEPSKFCLNTVYFEIKNIIKKFQDEFVSDGFFGYPLLVDALVNESAKLVEELKKSTEVQVDLHIARERNMKNYNHPDYDIYIEYYKNKIKGSSSSSHQSQPPIPQVQNTPQLPYQLQNISHPQQQDQQPRPTEKNHLGLFLNIQNNVANGHGSVIDFAYLDSKNNRDYRKGDRSQAAALILGYSEITAKNSTDMIPKIIYHQLVDEFKNQLLLRLYNSLKGKIDSHKLFHENETVTQKRKELKNALNELEEVERFLQNNKFAN